MKAAQVRVAVVGLGLAALLACGRDPLNFPAQVGGGLGGMMAPAGGTAGGGSGGAGGTGAGGVATDGGSDRVTPSDVRPGEFPLVVLPNDGPALPVGKTFRFRALVKLGATWRDLGAEPDLVWAIDDPLVADITPRLGRLTGQRPGKTIVRASHPIFGNAQVPVLVTASALARIAIQPLPLQMMVGQARPATALATYSDGSTVDVTQAAVWATADQRVAKIENGLPPIGQVTGVAAGTTIVSADFAGGRGELPAVVTGNAASTLSINPISASQTVGNTARFTAILRPPTGLGSDVSPLASWSSADPSVASLLGTGQFRCLSVGMTSVAATHLGLSASAPLACTMGNAVTLKELRISLSDEHLVFINTPILLTLDAIFSDGTSMTVESATQIKWETSAPGIATIDDSPRPTGRPGSAVLTGVAPGSATITATYKGLTTSRTYTFVPR